MNASISLVRAIHLASCLLLVGGIAFRLFVAQPVLTSVKKGTRLAAFDSLDHRLRTLTIWSVAVSSVSWCLWLWIVAARVSGTNLISALQPEILGTLLRRSEFGLLWEVRLGIIVGFAALLVVREQRREIIKLLFAVVLLATLSIAGHAAASISEGRWILLANDTFHLIAAGIWPAGLVPFAIFLTRALQARQPDEIQVAAFVAQRFSFVSLITVGALIITGGTNGYFLVGTFDALLSTVYGRLLVLKMGIFGAMVMVGAFNLLCLKPRIVVAAQSAVLGESLNLLCSLRRNVFIEFFLGTILVVVVGVLGVTPPAADFKMASS
jgi:copper resistance protein D